MESWIPPVLESCLHLLPATEKAAIQSATVDFQWLVDRSSSIWTAGKNTLIRAMIFSLCFRIFQNIYKKKKILRIVLG